MEFATYLLLTIGWLGALDIFAFHTRAQPIRTLPSARTELVTHALRGPTYALLFLAIPNLALRGAWCAALFALLAFDAAISVWDFAIERESRRPRGAGRRRGLARRFIRNVPAPARRIVSAKSPIGPSAGR